MAVTQAVRHSLFIAIAVLCTTQIGLAQTTVDCSSNSLALAEALAGSTSGSSFSVTGTCLPESVPGYFTFASTNVSVSAGTGGATISGQVVMGTAGISISSDAGTMTINGQVFVQANGARLTAVVIDGTGVTISTATANGGLVVNEAAANPQVNECTIQNWNGNGVFVTSRADVWVNGGIITNNAGAGLYVRSGTAELGDGPNGVAGGGVVVSSNGTGIDVIAGGSVTAVGGNVMNNADDGVDLVDRSSIVFSTDGGGGTVIVGNGGLGVSVDQGSHLTLGSGSVGNNGEGGIAIQRGSSASIGSNAAGGTSGTLTQITGNGSGGNTYAGAGVAIADSAVVIDGAAISGNVGGDAFEAIGGSSTLKNSSVSAISGHPAVAGFGATLYLQNVTATGAGNASAITLFNASSYLVASTISDNDSRDPTILAGGGSSLLSFGANTICAGALSGNMCTPVSNGTALTVSDGAKFDQIFGANNPVPQAADAITGGGSIEVESSAEVGSGASSSSSWVGTVTVAQNSAFRMDGGMTITGGIHLSQGSNGFFNTANGGQNIVTGGVTCPFTATQAAHVAGNTFVLTSSGGSSAVTIGSSAGDCLGF